MGVTFGLWNPCSRIIMMLIDTPDSCLKFECSQVVALLGMIPIGRCQMQCWIRRNLFVNLCNRKYFGFGSAGSHRPTNISVGFLSSKLEEVRRKSHTFFEFCCGCRYDDWGRPYYLRKEFRISLPFRTRHFDFHGCIRRLHANALMVVVFDPTESDCVRRDRPSTHGRTYARDHFAELFKNRRSNVRCNFRHHEVLEVPTNLMGSFMPGSAHRRRRHWTSFYVFCLIRMFSGQQTEYMP